MKKRRAKRSWNGAKQEVIGKCKKMPPARHTAALTSSLAVVAGTPSAPITQSIASDLERRGFIVYIVVSSASEEDGVRVEAKGDIHPLHLNVTDVCIRNITRESN